MDATRRTLTLSAIAATLAGAVAGLGGFTFWYARGASYLGHDASACANCHVMQDQYAGWLKSSHRAVAACNDCHTPGPLVAKYAVKMLNGYRHSFAFTSGRFHEPIAITPRDRAIVEQRCRDCHATVVEAIDAHPRAGARLACTRCHSTVGHL